MVRSTRVRLRARLAGHSFSSFLLKLSLVAQSSQFIASATLLKPKYEFIDPAATHA
jgi:hypothetical protein